MSVGARAIEHGGDPEGTCVIAFADTLFDAPLRLASLDGPAGVRFSSDPAELLTADAVVFHVPTLWRLPRRKPEGQLWVAWSMESAVNEPRLRDGRFLARFDLTMTYELSSDVPLPYALAYGERFANDLVMPLESAEKTSLVSSFLSSGVDRSGRRAWHQGLVRELPVACYGRIGRNQRLERDAGRRTKLEILGRSVFTLALENSIAPDYVTEKFFDPLVAGSIPVYLGAPNVDRFAPGDHCFINVNDFRSPSELASYLRHLASAEDERLAYHAWRRRPLRESVATLAALVAVHPFRRLAGTVLACNRNRRRFGLP
jgi:Glycosyltransferase family 10 (fucosyltransferase) C-term/Fucosyltransferase, N-terminal